MINGIGSTGRADAARVVTGQKAEAVDRPAAIDTQDARPTSPAAVLAAYGPPIDAAKVAAVRALIAEGRYTIDPQAIAAKMVELDLPLPGEKVGDS